MFTSQVFCNNIQTRCNEIYKIDSVKWGVFGNVDKLIGAEQIGIIVPITIRILGRNFYENMLQHVRSILVVFFLSMKMDDDDLPCCFVIGATVLYSCNQNTSYMDLLDYELFIDELRCIFFEFLKWFTMNIECVFRFITKNSTYLKSLLWLMFTNFFFV